MPRQATRLTMHFVRKMTLPNKYYNENGLILLVKETGAKSWVRRLTIRGCRDLELGPYPLVALGEVRQAAYDNRKLALPGGDSRETRAKRFIPTFREAAAVIEDCSQGRGAGRESRPTPRPDGEGVTGASRSSMAPIACSNYDGRRSVERKNDGS